MKQVEITSKVVGRGESEGITSAIPSINLSGFALKSDLLTLEKKFSDFLNVPIIDGTINRWNELETFLAGISEDYNLLSLLNGKADKSYVDTNFVTIAGTEDVTGLHNFVNGLKIGGLPITKKQDDVVYLDANLVVRGGITMYAENEVNIPSILDSLPIASNTALGIASFDSTYFSVDSNGMVTLTSAPSSGASTLGELLNVDASIDATASVDRILYQPQGSSMWTWRELTKDGVVGNYLPLSGGQMTGGIGTILNPKGYSIYTPVAGSFTFTSADDFATKASFIGSMRSLTNNNWFVGISARHANIDSSGGGDGTQYGMYLIANMEGAGIDFNNVSLQWNLQGRGVWGSTRMLLDTLNWRSYITPDNTLMINGGNSSGSFPALKFHIPDVNWSQFLMVGDGTVWLVGGASQSAERVGLAIGGLNCLSVLSHGGITMYSDQRKKTILNHVELSLKQIADAPLIQHYYNSDQNKTTHVGSIAQYWANLNDWFCKLDAEGFYTMEIQNCALASAISIARHLEKYETKTDKTIRKMKQRIQELEDEVERLKQN